MELQAIQSKIFQIRNQSVMLDKDLAELYQVPTKRINEAVKRNQNRFPTDFMFQLTKEEWHILKSQNATASWGGRRTSPYCFTEHGVLMLSSVLKSDLAAQVNIAIMRAFVAMRQHALNYEALATALKKLENSTNHRFAEVSKVLDALLEQKQLQENLAQRKRIGYRQ